MVLHFSAASRSCGKPVAAYGETVFCVGEFVPCARAGRAALPAGAGRETRVTNGRGPGAPRYRRSGHGDPCYQRARAGRPALPAGAGGGLH